MSLNKREQSCKSITDARFDHTFYMTSPRVSLKARKGLDDVRARDMG